jgi:hypothetical protein
MAIRRRLEVVALTAAVVALVVLLAAGPGGTAVRVFLAVLLACCLVAAAIAWMADRRAEHSIEAEVERARRDRRDGGAQRS